MPEALTYESWRKATKHSHLTAEQIIEGVNEWLLSTAHDMEPETLIISCPLGDLPLLPAVKRRVIKAYKDAGWPRVSIRKREDQWKIEFDRIDLLENS